MTTPPKTIRAATAPDGHRQRLREWFLASGLDGFHDYEVVELLLTLNTPRKDCKTAAKSAMARFKTLAAVLDARVLNRVNSTPCSVNLLLKNHLPRNCRSTCWI